MTGTPHMKILVVGATGSIGQLVVAEALRMGHGVRALVRDASKGRRLPPQTECVVGDLSKPDTLAGVTDGVEAIVFTHGAEGGKAASESVDYGGVRNILNALDGRHVRIALMTAIGVTNRTGSYNRQTEAHDWKRRGERLVRASGLEYTIVRPGWFDYNAPDELHLVLLQGDTRKAGNSSDGVISRRQIAQVLVGSLMSDAATRKTFELIAGNGPAQEDLAPLFAALRPDGIGGLEGVDDTDNQPLDKEPERVRADLQKVMARAKSEIRPHQKERH
jgi:uncharacterized protein YbjT (DUF2867 family)